MDESQSVIRVDNNRLTVIKNKLEKRCRTGAASGGEAQRGRQEMERKTLETSAALAGPLKSQPSGSIKQGCGGRMLNTSTEELSFDDEDQACLDPTRPRGGKRGPPPFMQNDIQPKAMEERNTQGRRKTEFSPCWKHRYVLWREWASEELLSLCPDESECCGVKAPSYLMVIGLNPSTADETQDDPTIRRCKDFAKRWGFGALCMTNLFAWRDTDPDKMKLVADPVGLMNDHWLRQCALGAGMILAAWGKHGNHRDRARCVRRLLESFEIHALALNNDGSPKHPLYVSAATVPFLLGSTTREIAPAPVGSEATLIQSTTAAH